MIWRVGTWIYIVTEICFSPVRNPIFIKKFAVRTNLYYIPILCLTAQTYRTRMSSVTCQVINALDSQPVAGLESILRCLSHKTTHDACTFRGSTGLDGGVHWWHPSNDFPSRKLEHLLEELGEDNSVWQIGFDTGGFFGVAGTCWPVVDVNFNLIPDKSLEPCQSYHIKLIVGPYGYETDLSLRPYVTSAVTYNVPSGSQTPPSTPIAPEIQITLSTPTELQEPSPSANPISLDVNSNADGATSENAAAANVATREILSQFQRNVLKQHFASEKYITTETASQLSSYLGLRRQKVQAWFCQQRWRNRRADSKRNAEQTCFLHRSYSI